MFILSRVDGLGHHDRPAEELQKKFGLVHEEEVPQYDGVDDCPSASGPRVEVTDGLSG